MSVQEGISAAFWGVKKVKPRETNITYPNVYVEVRNSDIAKMGSRIPCIRWWQVVRSMNDERMVSIHNDTPTGGITCDVVLHNQLVMLGVIHYVS